MLLDLFKFDKLYDVEEGGSVSINGKVVCIVWFFVFWEGEWVVWYLFVRVIYCFIFVRRYWV